MRKIYRKLVAALLVYSLTFSNFAHATPGAFFGGVFGGLIGGGIVATMLASTNKEIKAAAKKLDELKNLAKIVKGINETNEAIEGLVNSNGSFLLPSALSNGLRAIKIEDLKIVFNELLQGKSTKAKELDLNHEDILILLTLANLQPYIEKVNGGAPFENMLKELARLNEMDEFSTTDMHLALGSALLGHHMSLTAFKENLENKGPILDPGYEAAKIFFPTLIVGIVQKITEAATDEGKLEDLAEVIAGLEEYSMPDQGDEPSPQARAMTLRRMAERLAQSKHFGFIEKLEHVFLSVEKVTDNLSQEEVDLMDKSMTEGLMSKLKAKVKDPLGDKNKALVEKIDTETETVKSNMSGAGFVGGIILGALVPFVIASAFSLEMYGTAGGFISLVGGMLMGAIAGANLGAKAGWKAGVYVTQEQRAEQKSLSKLIKSVEKGFQVFADFRVSKSCAIRLRSR